MRIFRISSLSSSFVSICLVACNTVTVVAPQPQIEAPIVPGAGRHEVHFGGVPAKQVSFSSDASSRPPSFANQNVSDSHDLPVGGGIGLGSYFELGAQYGINSGGAGLKLKFQPVGPTATQLKAGAWLIAAFGHVSGASRSRSGEQEIVGGPGGFPWSSNANLTIAGGGGSVGFMIADKDLLYVGYSYDNYVANASIHQDPASNGSSGAADVSTQQFGYAQAVGLHFRLLLGSGFVDLGYAATHFVFGTLNPADNHGLSAIAGTGF